jgi:hypothetical protein
MSVQFRNNSFTTIAITIDDLATEITVATGTGASLPVIGVGEYFYATLSDIDGAMEIIKVTAVVGDVLTVERAQESTTAVPFLAGSLLENRFTAKTLRDIADLNYLLL